MTPELFFEYCFLGVFGIGLGLILVGFIAILFAALIGFRWEKNKDVK